MIPINNNCYVLDSFALLAYFGGEEGADRVEGLLKTGRRGNVKLYLNLISLGEVYYISAREDSLDKADALIARIRRFPLELVINEERLTLMAGRIKAFHSISYADAHVVATARDKDALIVTGDPEFLKVEELARILWIRKITSKIITQK